MFNEEYEKLADSERQQFAKIINELLAHTYILSEAYNFEDRIRRANKDYLFLERNFTLFDTYLNVAGMHLEKDPTYGVIALHSDHDANRHRFNRMTTLFIYGLRLIFEDTRKTLDRDVFTTTSELVRKLEVLGAIKNRVAKETRARALCEIASYNLIVKESGEWSDPDTRILICPSILFVVSNEQISNMNRLVEEETNEEID